MSWAAIGAATIGAGVSAYSASQQQKAIKGQTAEQAALTREQLQQQKEFSEREFAKELAVLTGTELGQEEALARAQEREAAGIAGFLAATGGTPEEVTRLQQIIREQQLPEQQQALRRAKLAQTQAGVRGPEAALLQQMQASELAKTLGLEVEKLGLEEALRRQRSREQFAGAQALAAQAATYRPVQKIGREEVETVLEQQKLPIATQQQKDILSKIYKARETAGLATEKEKALLDNVGAVDYRLSGEEQKLLEQINERGPIGKIALEIATKNVPRMSQKRTFGAIRKF
jgi:hypothetical protein